MNKDLRGFRAYQMHHSLQLHFNPNTDYDYFKYRGATKITPESFLKDKNRQIRYASIEKRVGFDNMELFFVCNMKDRQFKKFIPHTWMKTYTRELNLIQKFQQTLETDCQEILDSSIPFMYLFESGYENSLYPALYDLYKAGRIEEMTMIFFHLYIEPFLVYGKSNDLLNWKGIVDSYEKVIPFYRRCYFNRLDNMDEMKKTALETLSKSVCKIANEKRTKSN